MTGNAYRGWVESDPSINFLLPTSWCASDTTVVFSQDRWAAGFRFRSVDECYGGHVEVPKVGFWICRENQPKCKHPAWQSESHFSSKLKEHLILFNQGCPVSKMGRIWIIWLSSLLGVELQIFSKIKGTLKGRDINPPVWLVRGQAEGGWVIVQEPEASSQLVSLLQSASIASTVNSAAVEIVEQ